MSNKCPIDRLMDTGIQLSQSCWLDEFGLAEVFDFGCSFTDTFVYFNLPPVNAEEDRDVLKE